MCKHGNDDTSALVTWSVLGKQTLYATYSAHDNQLQLQGFVKRSGIGSRRKVLNRFNRWSLISFRTQPICRVPQIITLVAHYTPLHSFTYSLHSLAKLLPHVAMPRFTFRG